MIPSFAHRRPGAALLGAGAVAVAVLLSRGALAQRAAGDQAAADALYNEGRELLKAGKNAAACAKFEASFALGPATSTMLNIARCHEQDGKLATAWADYNRALSLNGDTPGAERRRELEALAQKGLHALEPRLPRLRVALTAPPPGVEVRSDDNVLPAAALGEALPVDPGPHQVRVSAPGYREETRSVTLEEGKTAVVEIALQRSADEPGRGWARPAGIALTTAGAVGLGIGAVTGVLSLNKVSAVKSESMCTSGSPCSTTDASGLGSAKTLGNVSTATFVAGGVLAAAGVVLLVLPSGGGARSSSVAGNVRLSLAPGRLDLRGSF
jgi:hypothetical protein